MRHFDPPLPVRSAGSPIPALRRLEPLFEAAGLGVWAVDLASDRVWWSTKTRRIHEVAADFQPRLTDALAFYAPEDRARLAATIDAARATGQPWDQTNRLVTATGTPLLLRSCGRALPGPDGAMRWLLGTCEDVTAARALEETARRELDARTRAEILLRDVLDSVPVLISAYDRDDRLLLANRMLLDWFPEIADVLVPGCPIEVSARAWYNRAFGIPDDGSGRLERIARNSAAQVAQGSNGLEIRLPDGRWVLSSSRRSPSGNLIWVRTDISALKSAELHARDAASRDALTGLLNRAGFMMSLKALRARAAPGQPPSGTLLLVDVDHFKSVNDSYGHEAGDLLLRLVARRLARAVRKTDVAARLGGDEFALFLAETGAAEAEARAAEILARGSRPLRLAGMTLVPSLSIGVASATPDIADCDELLRRADRALYAAKGQGRGRAIAYTAHLADALATRRRLAERLRRALAQGEVGIALQPQVHLATGRIDGFEALARWTDQGTPVPPPEFVAAADEHGLAGPLGQAILVRSLEAARTLATAAGRPIRVGVNVSTAQLMAEDFAREVLALLAEAGLPPSALELEITEHVLLDRGIARLASHLATLRAAGVRIALDDFGTGHASLVHLGTLPVDGLKVDRSFTAAIGRDRRGELLARTIISLARGLDLACVVEGVETEAQRRFLEAHGCTHVQGWLTGRPMPLEAALAVVGADPPHPAEAQLARRRTYTAGARGG